MSTENHNLLFAAELSLCLKDINLPKMFLQDALHKMAQVIKMAEGRENADVKQLGCYAQILHSAILSIESAEDAVSGLAMLLAGNEGVCPKDNPT